MGTSPLYPTVRVWVADLVATWEMTVITSGLASAAKAIAISVRRSRKISRISFLKTIAMGFT
jgi:hypothetical protein